MPLRCSEIVVAWGSANSVSFMARRTCGFTICELHNENRSFALFLDMQVLGPNSLNMRLMSGIWGEV